MFTEPGEFLKYLQGLIARHENDLAIILNSLDIAGPPTPEKLIYAHEVAPIRFTQLLAELDENFMNYTDAETAPEVKQSFLEKLFSAGKQVISTANAVKRAQPAGGSNLPPAPPEPKINTRKILIVGGIIVVVLVIVVVVIKSIKK